MPFQDWLYWNLKRKTLSDEGPWKDRFTVSMWCIWKWRNEEIFTNKTTNVERKVVVVRGSYREILSAFSNNEVVLGEPGGQGLVWVGWSPPPHGWMKLNSDGCVHKASMIVGVEGVFRKEGGGWIKGFSLNIGCYTIEEAELWALLHGLRMTWDTGTKRLLVEIDSLTYGGEMVERMGRSKQPPYQPNSGM